MAATTLTQASEDEILKIFQVVASKTIKSVDSLVKATQPGLNVLISETIDAFKSSPQRVDKVMDLLISRMKHLGVSVDSLTKNMDKVPKGMKSLQDALRAKEQKSIKAEQQVQALRDKGIAAEVDAGKVKILTSKEIRVAEEKFRERHKDITIENNNLIRRTEKLKDLSVKDRAKEEKLIVKDREKIVEKETKLAEDIEKKTGKPREDIQGDEGLIDPQGMFAPIVDQFMGIKDSITGPFIQIGEMGMRVAKSFKNFGKAMLTPIKSLKKFGAGLMLALVPMLGWALLIVLLVAVVALIIFKFKAIAKAVGEWWDGFKITLGEFWDGVKNIATTIKEWILNIPTMLGEALDSAYEFISGIGGRIWDALGSALTDAKNFIIDGFHSMINGMISMVNAWLPKKWEIPLIGKAAEKPAEVSAATKEEADVGTKFMKNQWNEVPSGVKGALKIDETTKTNLNEFKDSIAPVDTKAVIVQDNKTINNSQANAETSMVAKADKNPEPSSKWDALHEFTGA